MLFEDKQLGYITIQVDDDDSITFAISISDNKMDSIIVGGTLGVIYRFDMQGKELQRWTLGSQVVKIIEHTQGNNLLLVLADGPRKIAANDEDGERKSFNANSLLFVIDLNGINTFGIDLGTYMNDFGIITPKTPYSVMWPFSAKEACRQHEDFIVLVGTNPMLSIHCMACLIERKGKFQDRDEANLLAKKTTESAGKVLTSVASTLTRLGGWFSGERETLEIISAADREEDDVSRPMINLDRPLAILEDAGDAPNRMISKLCIAGRWLLLQDERLGRLILCDLALGGNVPVYQWKGIRKSQIKIILQESSSVLVAIWKGHHESLDLWMLPPDGTRSPERVSTWTDKEVVDGSFWIAKHAGQLLLIAIKGRKIWAQAIPTNANS